MTDAFQQHLRESLGAAYTITRELSGGGMSRVFLGEEVALNRRVVVKVLPPETAAAMSTDRFRREIALAARLQHPHIVPLLTAGDAQGLPYFTMPFVEGESLRVRLARRGELPVAEAIRLLREVASALQYAHEHGVVHRDIKPDNVLLSGGAAMVTDFGIAKAISASTQDDGTPTRAGQTSLGVALGTPAYMSPEQASADPAVDHRADLYAFGVLAYEALTGQPPFAGRTPQGLLSAHVTETPEPIQARRVNLPPGLAALVMRCLEKRPADRPQTAAEIVHALDEVTTPSGGTHPTSAALPAGNAVTVGPRRRILVATMVIGVVAAASALAAYAILGGREARPIMIAVLPFDNEGPPADEYFAEGLAEEITDRLANIKALGVIAQRSTSEYRRSTKPLKQIGRELGVEYVLQVTVRWQTDASGARKAQVRPALVRVSDGTVRWAGEPYVIVAADVFGVQNDIATRVASALDIALTSSTTPAPVEPPTRNADAYDAYLRGLDYQRQYFARTDNNLNDLAILQFGRAIHLDTTFALAQAKLAISQVMALSLSLGDSAKARQVQASSARALELAPRSADAHFAKALQLELIDTVLTGAITEFQQALDLRPGDAWILNRLGDAKSLSGDSAGLSLIARSVELDPRNGDILQSAVNDFGSHRRFAEAERYTVRWETLAPDNPDPLALRAGIVLAARGDTAETMRLLGLADARTTRLTSAMLVNYAAVSQGNERIARLRLPAMLAQTAQDSMMYYVVKAVIYMRLGRPDLRAKYADSAVTFARRTSIPGALDVQIHGVRAAVASIAGNRAELAAEAATTIQLASRWGPTNTFLGAWACSLAFFSSWSADVEGGMKQQRLCLSLPSGQTAWNVVMSPEWNRLRDRPQVQALLRDFPVTR